MAKAIPNGTYALHRFPSEREKLLADRSLLTRRLLGSAPEGAMLHAVDAAGLPVPRQIGGQ